MDEMACVLCEQPVENCGRRSDRRAFSFQTVMMQGFQHGVVVPCKFQEQLNKFANSKNWMVVACPRDVYDFYLQKDGPRTTICEPFWRSLMRHYDIHQGDVLSFEYVEEDNGIEVTVYELVNNVKQEKPHVGNSVVYDVIPRTRALLHKTIFSDIRAITEHDMAAIIWGIYKVVVLAPVQELDDDEFYERTNELQFFVHKYNGENVHFDALFLSPETFNKVRCPTNGHAHFWRRGLEEPIIGWYHIEGDEHVAFSIGWPHFREDSNIVEGSLLLMIGQPRTEAIVLDFVEIINPE